MWAVIVQSTKILTDLYLHNDALTNECLHDLRLGTSSSCDANLDSKMYINMILCSRQIDWQVRFVV